MRPDSRRDSYRQSRMIATTRLLAQDYAEQVTDAEYNQFLDEQEDREIAFALEEAWANAVAMEEEEFFQREGMTYYEAKKLEKMLLLDSEGSFIYA